MNDKLSNQEKINMMHKLDEDFNKSEAAELLGVSRTMIYKYIKNIK
jgi:predicted transcriptional regulator